MWFFIDLRVNLSIPRFGLHDMKRRSVTDTPGTQADKLDASGLSDFKILRTYDKSKPIVKPAPG